MRHKTDYNPKIYFDNDRKLIWGKKLNTEQLKAMENGEIFTLRDKSGAKHSRILKDSYGQIREQLILEEINLSEAPQECSHDWQVYSCPQPSPVKGEFLMCIKCGAVKGKD
jgi:hypothetical protein